MLNRKSLSVLAIAFIFCITSFLFCQMANFQANADVQTSDMVTVVEEGFIFNDDFNPTAIINFTVPDYVNGYFKIVIPEGIERIVTSTFIGTEPVDYENPGDEEFPEVPDVPANTTLSGGEKLYKYLVAVEIPASVNEIDEDAFINCNNLLEVVVKGSVENIQGFDRCGLQDAISIGNESTLHAVNKEGGSYLFVRNGGKTSTSWIMVKYDGTTNTLSLPAASECDAKCTDYVISDNAFAECEFASVTIPEGVTQIGENAFQNCTNLTSLKFDKRQEEATPLIISKSAFAGCTGLKLINIPNKTEIHESAFVDCMSLAWVYIGNDCKFVSQGENSNAKYFPTKNANLKIIFTCVEEYNKVLQEQEIYSMYPCSTYFLNVNFFIGDSEEPMIYPRMFLQDFNYVYNEQTNTWGPDSMYNKLPVQASHYKSTVWYQEKELIHPIDIKEVNRLIASAGVKEVNLYCYETVNKPVFPADPATWVYNSGVSYSVDNKSDVLKALSCQNTLTEKELAALEYEVVYADSDSNVKETPAEIKENGVYSVTFRLNSKYGEWSEPAISSITVNVDTSAFLIVLVVLLLVAAVAAIVTVSTAVIRKKVQKKNKKKQLSSQEVLEKFRAAGGETDLK